MDWRSVLVSSSLATAAATAVATWLIERQKATWSRRLQEHQNTFSIGVTSHMAQIAFDKHVEFCEKYIEEFFRALQTLSEQGQQTGFPEVAGLEQTRRKYAVWLTRTLDDSLQKLEVTVTSAWWFQSSGSRVSNDSYERDLKDKLREFLNTESISALRDELIRSPRPSSG